MVYSIIVRSRQTAWRNAARKDALHDPHGTLAEKFTHSNRYLGSNVRFLIFKFFLQKRKTREFRGP